jgi:hypothetical protein
MWDGTEDPRRQCKRCGQRLHYTRFRSWRDSRCRYLSVIQFAPRCRACEQLLRNRKKNEDRLATSPESKHVARD